jgi:aminoglycoside 6'-N-acetyltransferase I
MHMRPVEPTDHAEWLRMRLTLWGGAAEEHTHNMDTYFVTPQGGITFVVESTGGGLCGFIEVSLRDYAEGCSTSPVSYIEGWYVDEESRRHKLGTRLVQAAEVWARNQGLKEMASDTQIDNTASIQAHTRLGYKEMERLVCFRTALDASDALQDDPADASAATPPQRAVATHAPQPQIPHRYTRLSPV